MTKNRPFVLGLIAVMALLSAACNQTTTQDDQAADSAGPSVTITSPEDGTTVEGNVVVLGLQAEGIEIVPADGDTSGETGHFHIFIDIPPVAPGEEIAKQADIIHSTDTSVSIPGLSAGEHSFTVVLGDGTHTRIGGAADTVTVQVDGPTVQVIAEPTVEETDEGAEVSFEVDVQGAEIVAADGDDSGETGHLHVFIDPGTAPEADGNPIAKEDDIIHTTDTEITVPLGDRSGEITLYIVLGDGNHVPFSPLVMDKVVIEV